MIEGEGGFFLSTGVSDGCPWTIHAENASAPIPDLLVCEKEGSKHLCLCACTSYLIPLNGLQRTATLTFWFAEVVEPGVD